jgi:hypothetical protein
MSELVRYSEYEAYRSNWRYLSEQSKRSHEAAMRWMRENSNLLDAVFGAVFLAYFAWWLLRCYRYCCPAAHVDVDVDAELPADKKRIRTQLVNVEHAIQALNDHRTCLMLKLKRD